MCQAFKLYQPSWEKHKVCIATCRLGGNSRITAPRTPAVSHTHTACSLSLHNLDIVSRVFCKHKHTCPQALRTARHIGPERSYVQDQLCPSTNRVRPLPSDAELISFFYLPGWHFTRRGGAAASQQIVVAGRPAQGTRFTGSI